MLMMALKEDSSYGLFSRDSLTAANISCIHVKLTDSALRFIEDSVKSNKSSRPTLEVNDDHGVFRIPLGTSHKDFDFSISALSGDPNGSFDCIKQCREGRLETLDTMTQKILVRATDDVYQTTRDKLTVKNEESKKNCAKELDHTKGGIKSKRVIKTIKRNGNDNVQTSSQSAKSVSSGWNLPRSPHRLTNSIVEPASSPPTTSMHTNNPYATQVANSQTTAAKKLDKIKRRQKTKLNTAAKEAAVAHNKSNGVTKSEKEKAKAALSAVPVRERVIHLLAAKPNVYDTPNLLCKLKSDGINSGSEPSANEISLILEHIASTNSKGCWSVRPEFYHEVDPNWGFYSETDKQLVKRNMNKASVKPIVTVHPTSDSRKRRLEADIADGETLKLKQHKNHIEDVPEDDFLGQYIKIQNSDQRHQYKEDFNSEYEEYRNLYDYMERINKKFSDLADKLNATSHGSAQYQKVEKKIKKEYKSVSSSKEYLANKPRLEYLHRKLAHIKKLVGDYDQALLGC